MNTIFVSSTFQDMQQERDLLRDQVLPLLKAEIKRYGRNIELCDLRWGVNSLGMEKEDRDIKVLQVCFNEIDKAKPFFIVLLGDRYGRVLDEEVVKRILNSKEMQDSDYFGKSVTEMEILYGALKAENPANIFFYFRKIKNAKKSLFFNKSSLPAAMQSGSKDDQKHLESLKKRILTQFPDRVRTYEVTWNAVKKEFDGMDAFCHMVCHDLTQVIRDEYGTSEAVSIYDTQLHQYEYALSEHVYLDQETFLQMTQGGSLQRLSSILLPDFSRQICLLVSKNIFGLNQVFSNLCTQWGTQADVIPYCCDQSMSASSLHNMLLYFSAQLSRRLGAANENHTQEAPIDKFHRLLQETEEAGNGTVVLAIRGLHHLDERELFKWLPLTQYRHIRFLLSTNSSPASPASFKALAEEVYFPDYDIIDRRSFIHAYMSAFHKEADVQLCDAIIEKSKDRNEQYMELLMQRLMVLSKQDFQTIQNNGDGIEQISSYLAGVTRNAPDTAEELAEEQIRLLKQETSEEFVDTVLCIMLVLPSGISRRILEDFLVAQQVSYASLDMMLLCRRLFFAVRETLDGFYRFIPDSLRADFSPVSETAAEKVSAALEVFFQKLDTSSNVQDVLECYQNNRLFLAARNHNDTVLPVYLQRTGHNKESFALLLPHLLADETVRAWLHRSVGTLDMQDIEWMLHSLYRLLADRKWNYNPVLTLPLTDVWKRLAERAEALAALEQNKNSYENWFFSVFQTGEMAYLHKQECAAQYLEQAKSISKEAFSLFKNRIWKTIHGVPLTEEELRMGHDSLPEEIQEEVPSVMFGFNSELEDMHLMQLWSAQVRMINNYLSDIYRQNGDVKKAECLEEEARTITQIADYDPLNQGVREILPGITVVYPDEEIGAPNTQKKRRYKPDYRRNSAIQLSKAARQLIREDRQAEAMQNLTESSQILMEIYEDGETCQYYDMHDVTEDAKKAAQRIRMEAARDLSMNAQAMIGCMEIREDNQELCRQIEEMLRWAELYDANVNTVQSKGDLEEWYLLSANIYHEFHHHDVYFNRILHDVERFYHYRLEAHKLGEMPDEYIMKLRATAGVILYEITIAQPEHGNEVTKLLQEHSNQCVIANDINGSIQLTRDMEALLEWMWSSSYFWKQPEYSLEFVYICNMENHTMLWKEHGRLNELFDYGKRMSRNILHLKDARNVGMGCICIIRYVQALIQHDDIQRAADAADPVVEAFEHFGTEHFRISALEMYATMIGVYSDACRFEKALHCSEKALVLYAEIGVADYETAEQQLSRKQVILHVEAEHARIHLFRGIALSRSGQRDEGEACLARAEAVFRDYPELAGYDQNLYSGVMRFMQEGLPGPEYSDQPAETERFHAQRKRIEDAFSRCRGDNLNPRALWQIEALIEELTDLPEYEQSKTCYTMAKYYHVLSQMYGAVGDSTGSMEILRKAIQETEADSELCALYAEIYSDYGALSEDIMDIVAYMEKSVQAFEELEEHGEEFSLHSYAMALYNFGVVNYRLKRKQIAYRLTEKAIKIWKKATVEGNNPSIQAHLAEAERLLNAILYQ